MPLVSREAAGAIAPAVDADALEASKVVAVRAVAEIVVGELAEAADALLADGDADEAREVAMGLSVAGVVTFQHPDFDPVRNPLGRWKVVGNDVDPGPDSSLLTQLRDGSIADEDGPRAVLSGVTFPQAKVKGLKSTPSRTWTIVRPRNGKVDPEVLAAFAPVATVATAGDLPVGAVRDEAGTPRFAGEVIRPKPVNALLLGPVFTVPVQRLLDVIDALADDGDGEEG